MILRLFEDAEKNMKKNKRFADAPSDSNRGLNEESELHELHLLQEGRSFRIF